MERANQQHNKTDIHLFVHEYVYKRVDDGGALGQQRRSDARLGSQQVRRAEGGEQSRHSVRQPAA